MSYPFLMDRESDAFEHVQQRMAERYGIEVDADDVAHMEHCIQHGVASYALSSTPKRSLWYVPLDGRLILAVYNEKWGRIVTVLPPSISARKWAA